MLRVCFAFTLLWLIGITSFSQVNPQRLRAAPFFVSRSGQFHVRLQQQPEIREAMKPGEVFLEANFVSVSAERVKQRFLRELNLRDHFKGKIHLAIMPGKSSSEIIPVVATSYNDGWHYTIELPQRIGEIAFVRALSHALLLELANRNGAPRSADIPLWMNEGFAQKLLYEVGGGFLVKPETYVDQQTVRFDPGFFFRERKPDLKFFTFAELGGMSPSQATNEVLQSFIASSLLFVTELLKLPNGQKGFVAMLQALPHRWNWQAALLEGYSPHFRTLLDVEKWWSVTMVELAGQQNRLSAATQTALTPLDYVLTANIQERTATNTLPGGSAVNLQEFIRKTDFAQQREVLKQKHAELTAILFRTRAELMPLIGRYRTVLEEYYAARDTTTPVGVLPMPPAALERAATEKVLRELDKLDAERNQLKQQFADASSDGTDPRIRDPRRQR